MRGHERLVYTHGLAALTLALLILAWGALLSPPLKPLREALGVPEYPGARFNGWAAEIIAGEGGEEFLARIAHYYHSLFAALLYGTLVLCVAAFKPDPRLSAAVLGLAGAGALITAAGGLGYAYIAEEPWLHGLFIAGLATLFSAGLLALRLVPWRDPLGLAAGASGALLLLGGALGGYLGASFMEPGARQELVEAVIASRFDPGLGEESSLWRLWTGHQHAMVAIALTLTLAASLKLSGLRDTRPARIAAWLIAPSAAVMGLASYAVWLAGGRVHLIITPAALLLTVSAMLASLYADRREGPLHPKGALGYALPLGVAAIWLFVNIPGALVAMSLKEPRLFDPPVRSPERDWMELAFNIGHWHYLITAWGAALLASAAAIAGKGRLGAAATWLALAGLYLTGLGYNLYYATAPPQPYQPNPYNNTWLTLLIEPGLTIIGLACALTWTLLAKAHLTFNSHS